MEKAEQKKTVCFYLCFIIGLGGFGAGYCVKNFNVALVGLCILLLVSFIWTLWKIKDSFLFLLFQIMMFTFLFSRPIIGIIKGEIWWEEAMQAGENVWFALVLLLLAEVGLFIGANIAKYVKEYLNSKNKQKVDMTSTKFWNNLQAVSMLIFYITMLFRVIEQFEPLIVIGVGDYLTLYSGYESQLPVVFHTIAAFMKYSLCLFLGTLPSKRRAFFPLGLYVLSNVPSLLVGVRNPFILSLIFCLVYYLLRDRCGQDSRKKWFGKVEKVLLFCGIPLGLIFLDVYANFRSGLSAAKTNPVNSLIDFFWSQGVTFGVLQKGYGYRMDLKALCPINYTFGNILDYFIRGSIGQKVFGMEPLTAYNSEFNAIHSNNLSHALSYLYLKNEYLEGKGTGSSFLLENYIDFGYLGCIIFCIILGFILLYAVYCFGKRSLLNTIILVSLTGIFFIPRAEATDWLVFIVTIQFWLCMAGCYLGAYICSKVEIFERILRFLHFYPKEYGN